MHHQVREHVVSLRPCLTKNEKYIPCDNPVPVRRPESRRRDGNGAVLTSPFAFQPSVFTLNHLFFQSALVFRSDGNKRSDEW